MTDQPIDNATPIRPDFDKGEGLLPVVAQDATSREVLMLAFMNAEAYDLTLATGEAVYFSRSRERLWKKGETSGHVQRVKCVRIDCDNDAILIEVEQVGGAACHTGFATCFYREATADGSRVVADRVFDPQQVYKQSE